MAPSMTEANKTIPGLEATPVPVKFRHSLRNRSCQPIERDGLKAQWPARDRPSYRALHYNGESASAVLSSRTTQSLSDELNGVNNSRIVFLTQVPRQSEPTAGASGGDNPRTGGSDVLLFSSRNSR